MHSEKVGAFRANRTDKVGAFRANKTQKRGLYRAAHTRTALMWEYPPGHVLAFVLPVSVGPGRKPREDCFPAVEGFSQGTYTLPEVSKERTTSTVSLEPSLPSLPSLVPPFQMSSLVLISHECVLSVACHILQ